MATTQVANKNNRELSRQHTRQSGRIKRIEQEYRAGAGTISGDFKNKEEQKAWKNKQQKTGLTQQELGNRKGKYRDLVLAFGRKTREGGLAFSIG